MNLDFNEICRLCLRCCEEYVDLNQTNGAKTVSKEVSDRIKFCYFIQIDLSEGLPTKVCYECIQVVSYFYKAKKDIIVSEQLLKDVLHTRKKLKKGTEIQKENDVNTNSAEVIDIKQSNDNSTQSLSSAQEKPKKPKESGTKSLKKLQNKQENNSKAVKENAAEKGVIEFKSSLKENVKEIGTVIDISNILSPNVKRTRKSINKVDLQHKVVELS